MMSVIGTPSVGDRPTFKVDSSVSAIKRGDIMVMTETMTVKPTTSTARAKLIGVAAEDWPKVTNNVGIAYPSEATDKGPRVYATSGLGKGDRIAIDMEGAVWVNIIIPASGADITIVAGNKVVPGTQAGVSGGGKALDLSTPSNSAQTLDLSASVPTIDETFTEETQSVQQTDGGSTGGVNFTSVTSDFVTDTVRPGDEVVVTVSPANVGRYVIKTITDLNTLVLADGTTLTSESNMTFSVVRGNFSRNEVNAAIQAGLDANNEVIDDTIVAAVNAAVDTLRDGIADWDRYLGIALSNIHKGLVSNDADLSQETSLGTNEISNGVLAATADIQYGKVLVKLSL